MQLDSPVKYPETYARRFGSPSNCTYFPLPGRLGDILGNEVLLHPTSAGTVTMLVTSSCYANMRIWRSPVCGGTEVDYAYNNSFTPLTSGLYYFCRHTTYLQLCLGIHEQPRSDYGYDSKNKWIIRYWRYSNHVWIGLPPTHGGDWVIFPVEFLMPEYGSASGSTIYQAPDYDWGNGLPCPNVTGGEVLL